MVNLFSSLMEFVALYDKTLLEVGPDGLPGLTELNLHSYRASLNLNYAHIFKEIRNRSAIVAAEMRLLWVNI